MSKIVAFVASFALLVAATTPAFAAGTADAVVKAQLQSKGVKFDVDKDGDFKVVYKTHDGRTQLAYVRSLVSTYGVLKIREIWSPGYKGDSNEMPALIANSLLEQNHDAKLGAWESQGNVAMFVVKIPADANADQLLDAIELAVNSADAMEEQLTGKKDEL